MIIALFKREVYVMHDIERKDVLRVEVGDVQYEIGFGMFQLEITGKCNMCCRHCRAANELCKDVPIEQIAKVVKFAKRYSLKQNEIVISGGEPLIYRQFPEVLRVIRNSGYDVAVMTTNGSLVSNKHLELIESLDFKKFVFLISLDDLIPAKHDEFRRFSGAYNGALKALDLTVSKNLSSVATSLLVTVLPDQIDNMHGFVELALSRGCDMVSFSGVFAVGAAKHEPQLWMTPIQKRAFIENIQSLTDAFSGRIRVSTNDPLKCILSDVLMDDDRCNIVLNGCTSGSATVNVNSNGDMTPCALLEVPIMNVFDLSVEEIALKYQSSDVIKSLIDMRVKGKCGTCDRRRQCGECRARAFSLTGDFLVQDPDCWL